MPGCFFRQITGFECPGCGMTRAGYEFLNGRIGDAFALNPVGMVIFPWAMVAVGIEVLGWVRGKPMPYRFKAGRRGAIILAVVIIGWWILRNLI